MPYYLQSQTSPSLFGEWSAFVGAEDDFRLEFQFSYGEPNGRPLGKDTSFNSRILMFNSGTTVRLHSETANVAFSTSLTVGNPNVFVFERVSGVLSLLVNGVSTGTPGELPGAFSPDRIFEHNNNFPSNTLHRLYYLKLDINGVSSRSFLNTTGTGNFIDTLGGDPITIINPRADDSHWVFYEADPSEIPVLSSPSASSITASSIVPNVTLTF